MRKAAVLLVGALLLAGCSSQSDPHPQPLSRFDQIREYEAATKADWIDVYGALGTPAPDLRVKTVSTGSQWVLDIAGCLREQGAPDFTVTPEGQITLQGSGSGDNGVGQRTVQLCMAQHPKVKWLTQELSHSQLDALYDYYVYSLAPCLMVNADRPLIGTPSRADFIRTFTTSPWTPYDRGIEASRVGSDGEAVPTGLAIKCPPYPGWLSKLGY